MTELYSTLKHIDELRLRIAQKERDLAVNCRGDWRRDGHRRAALYELWKCAKELDAFEAKLDGTLRCP